MTHYSDVIKGSVASQITSLTIVYSKVNSGTDDRKHQSSASLAFVLGIHRWPVNSPHKWPVTRKMFPFDDVIMQNIVITIDVVAPNEASHSAKRSLLQSSNYFALNLKRSSIFKMFCWSVIIENGVTTNPTAVHVDGMPRKRLPHYQPLVMEIHRSLALTKGQYCISLVSSLLSVWTYSTIKQTVVSPVVGNDMTLMWCHCGDGSSQGISNHDIDVLLPASMPDRLNFDMRCRLWVQIWLVLLANVTLYSISCSSWGDCVVTIIRTWWCHQMETFSALLAIRAGIHWSPVTREFPAQRPVTRSFDVFFDLRLNKRLSKQSWGWWFETQSCPLWHHCNEHSKSSTAGSLFTM